MQLWILINISWPFHKLKPRGELFQNCKKSFLSNICGKRLRAMGDILKDKFGILFHQVWGEVTETRVFATSDVRACSVDKQVAWSMVKQAQLSSLTNLRDGENRVVPCLSGEISTNIVFPSPQQHLTKHPLRKGRRERERVMRASRDPRVYILTSLGKMKGTKEGCDDGQTPAQAVSGVKAAAQSGEAVPEEDPPATNAKEGSVMRSQKCKRARKTGVTMPFKKGVEEETGESFVIPTLDLSAEVSKIS